MNKSVYLCHVRPMFPLSCCGSLLDISAEQFQTSAHKFWKQANKQTHNYGLNYSSFSQLGRLALNSLPLPSAKQAILIGWSTKMTCWIWATSPRWPAGYGLQVSAICPRNLDRGCQ